MAGGPQVKAISGTQDAPAPEKKIQDLRRGEATFNDISGNLWRVYIKQDVEPQALEMHPTFWNSLADDVREADEICAVWNSCQHFARYVVVNVQNGAVAVRLAYAVKGAPIMSATGPKSFPAGYHIEKARQDEGGGYVVVRESDGKRLMTSGGVPYRSYQDAYTEFPKSAMFRSEDVVRHVPA